MRIETLITNSRILTMDRARPEVEAVAITDGRIVALGAMGDLLAQRDRDTTVIDLGGRFACPAFIDPHNHFGLTAFAPVEADCRTPPLAHIDQLVEHVAALAATVPAGTWLRGHGYDEEHLRERRHPTRADLDAAAPDHPVVLVHWSVHRVALNSAALAALGIDPSTPDPPGGWIVKAADDVPNGVLYETATNPAQARSIAAYAERFATAAPTLIEANAPRYLATGITAVGDTYVSSALMAQYDRAVARAALPLHVSTYWGAAEGLFAPPRNLPELETDTGSPLRRAGIKLFVDGGGNTTATSLTGAHARRAAGRTFYAQDDLTALVTAAHGRGLQVAIHAAGDIAAELALTAFEAARTVHPQREARFRIEHGMIVTAAQIERMAALDVVLVAQPLAVYYHGDKLATAPLAEGRLPAPTRDLLTAGVTVAASSDAPCFPMHPLLSVWSTVTRRTAAGSALSPQQALSVDEALYAVTAGAARALFMGDERGTLAPGMAADLAVLSADPRTVPPNALRAITVEQTWRAGSLAYDRARDGDAPVVGRYMDSSEASADSSVASPIERR